MVSKLIKGVAAAALLSAASASQAGLVFMDMAEVPMGGGVQPTNWNTVVQLAQYGGMDTITSIKVTLMADVVGSAQIESLDGDVSNVTYSVSANVTATGPGTFSVTTIPLAGGVQALGAFDGLIDFAGASGFSSGVLAGNDMDMGFVPVGDIALYLGAGTVNFTLDAIGSSSASGAGNLITIFQTAAGAKVKIEYFSDTAIPSPAALPVGLGAFGLLALRRARKQA
jgi:hypothetical protein